MQRILLLLFWTCFITGDEAALPELRLKAIQSGEPLRTINPEFPASCIDYSSSNAVQDPSVITSTISIYKPLFSERNPGGFLVVFETVTTRCTLGWLGEALKEVIGQTVQTESSINPLFLQYISIILKGKKKPIADFSEVMDISLDGDLYACSYFSEHTMKTTLRAKVKSIPLSWNIDYSLLSPIINPLCLSNNITGSCWVSPSSLLIYDPNPSHHGCAVVEAVTFSGILSLETPGTNQIWVNFIAYSHDFSLSHKLGVSPRGSPLCKTDYLTLYSSDEGHLFSYSTREHTSDFEKIIKQSGLRWESHYHELPGYLSNQIRQKRSPKSLHPPPLISIGGPDLERRNKRHAVWEYQESQRLQVLIEQQSWGFSRIGAEFHETSINLASWRLRDRYDKCMIRRSLLISNLALTDKYPYISLLLNDKAILVSPSYNRQVQFLLGKPVASIRYNISDPDSWCNGTLRVMFRFPDDLGEQLGWLVNGKGLILSDPLVINQCEHRKRSTDFWVPTFSRGDYNLIETRYRHQRDKTPSHGSFHINLPDIAIETGSISLQDIAGAMVEHEVPDGNNLHNEMSLFGLYTSPELVKSSTNAWYISRVVLPFLLGNWTLLCIIMFLMCCCCGSTNSKSLLSRLV